MATQPVLSVRGLTVEYATSEGVVHAVTDVSFDVFAQETLGIVGESGSGKTATCLAILGLLQAPAGRIAGGEILFRGSDLTRLKSKDYQRLRGGGIAMIFQESTSSLNPVATVGHQLTEAIRAHQRALSRTDRRTAAVALLRLVGLPEPERQYRQYPHELSGGMRQRVMIAIAIANDPTILVADEPTTALDVTIQAQIVTVLQRVREESDAATLLVTHDLGLISQIADRVIVMYAGRVMEQGNVFAVLESPRHPYTIGLLTSVPRLSGETDRLVPIPGQPPSLVSLGDGCPFQPRCALSQGRSRCREEIPGLRPIGSAQHLTACHFADELENDGEQCPPRDRR